MPSNRHGLSRSIPNEIKRSVRQRCGFGCVVCGASIYEYDHYDPEFADAHEHSLDGITLLCPTHHAEKTRGILPLSAVRAANGDPTARRNGQTSVVRPYFEHIPTFSVGGSLTTINTPIPVSVRGEPLIEFLPPEEGSNITRINARITSAHGEDLLKIVENEWIVETGVWDYEWVGQRMTIRDSNGQVSLQITVFPPHSILVDRLKFRHFGYDVDLSETGLRINGMIFNNIVVEDCGGGIALG
jgi:hypothetical protein